MEDRAKAIGEIASLVCRDDLGHPVRVGVDGVTASGKSMLAGELAQAVAGCGRRVIHLTMDGFHHPREHRYRRGRMSGEGYYDDAFDFAALARHVLVPLGPGGDRCYRTRIIDLASDERIEEPALEAPVDAVLILDGSFLQRPELAGLWDHLIFVNTSLAVARSRGVCRDADRLGGQAAAERAFDERYQAASRIYLDTVRPAENATLIVDNDDLTRPRLRTPTPTLRHSPPRLE
jgi:uridine kinase